MAKIRYITMVTKYMTLHNKKFFDEFRFQGFDKMMTYVEYVDYMDFSIQLDDYSLLEIFKRDNKYYVRDKDTREKVEKQNHKEVANRIRRIFENIQETMI